MAEIHEFDQAIEIAKQPWPATFDAVNGFAKTHPKARSQSMPRGLLDNLTLPYWPHVATNVMTSYVNAVAEMLARARSSVGSVAVARYASDHAGALPESLRILIPGYLSAALIDPFSGEELKYRLDAGGFKVYSVGANRKDDGGQWEPQSDLQLSRRGNPPDVGIAVPFVGPQERATEKHVNKPQKNTAEHRSK